VARLVYTAITSLDGFVNDASGGFEWAAPDEELHAAANDVERGVGTHLLGRRLYEVMRVWDTWDTTHEPDVIAEFADLWRSTDKVVYSSMLDEVTTARTRLERSFDADTVRALVAGSERDVSVGGPTLAAEAIRAGLVDEYHWFALPVVIGSGTHWLPTDARLDLELVDERRFAGGAVHLHYRSR